ncbi:hypothetical protein NAEGRDRAFT_77912 [Naegleria gruberi]|uniref:Uncharacterized protein n=1 Tax=Naegleria gruberi TaxID=5762 RepID=D2UZD8_NAEGR|nr:uncharacterized protein NAEGRDRAFT_77912 [Naegleria gruberi]EFC49931.1 hypothetical protein NAEGRDRAFT_77912 [Naegleria gruberi]|eukprot:XP_002682675.1 hypothetical protein NAEGRDRAFT_77912 [Naegleria gruberi strain NEG-M]
MSKRNREEITKRYLEDADYDDSDDEDYEPSDEESQQKINPNQSGREKIKQLPEHLKGKAKIEELNKIHFDIFTSFDQDDNANNNSNNNNTTDDDELSRWDRERSIFLCQNILHGDEDEMFSSARLVRTFATHISKFDSLQEQVMKEEDNDENKKKKQVLLSIQCRNKSNIDVILKFFIGGEALTELDTQVPKKQIVDIRGYDDMIGKLRRKLLIDAYEPMNQSSSSSASGSNSAGGSSSSNSSTYLRDYGSIKIEVYQAIREKSKIDSDYEDDSDEEEDEEKDDFIATSSSEVEKLSRYTQNMKQQERCGMQVSFKASRIERPKKKVKRKGKKAKFETIFEEGPLLFQSVYKYRSYLGFLCELQEYNIDLGKTKNMARGRSLDNESSSSDDESSSSDDDDENGIKTEEQDDGGFIDITDDVEEPPKIIPTVSLDSDDEEETDVKPTAAELEKHAKQSSICQASSSTSSSAIQQSSSAYSFKETIQDVEKKNVDNLMRFIKLNDETLYNEVKDIFKKFQVSGSKLLSRTLDYPKMGVSVKYQIKILQIVDKIIDNSM